MQRISSSGDLAPAVESLRRGGVILYPTETFYALGADPWNEIACARLRALKGRPEEKDFPWIVADTGMVERFCEAGDPRYARLSARFWPGPLTIVLPALSGAGSFAVRISSEPVACRLSGLLGGPLISTSANSSGEPPVADPRLLPDRLQEGVDLLVDGGPAPGGLPSTIISLLSDPARILREGAIPASRVLSVL